MKEGYAILLLCAILLILFNLGLRDSYYFKKLQEKDMRELRGERVQKLHIPIKGEGVYHYQIKSPNPDSIYLLIEVDCEVIRAMK